MQSTYAPTLNESMQKINPETKGVALNQAFWEIQDKIAHLGMKLFTGRLDEDDQTRFAGVIAEDGDTYITVLLTETGETRLRVNGETPPELESDAPLAFLAITVFGEIRDDLEKYHVTWTESIRTCRSGHPAQRTA